jgi:hypothetical protein
MLTYNYVFHGVYNTYDGNIYSGVSTLTTCPADDSNFSVSHALHTALNVFYNDKGYWSSWSLISLDKRGETK